MDQKLKSLETGNRNVIVNAKTVVKSFEIRDENASVGKSLKVEFENAAATSAKSLGAENEDTSVGIVAKFIKAEDEGASVEKVVNFIQRRNRNFSKGAISTSNAANLDPSSIMMLSPLFGSSRRSSEMNIKMSQASMALSPPGQSPRTELLSLLPSSQFFQKSDQSTITSNSGKRGKKSYQSEKLDGTNFFVALEGEGDSDFDILEIKEWIPLDPGDLATKEIKNWTKAMDRDNKTLQLELMVLENFWLRNRSNVVDRSAAHDEATSNGARVRGVIAGATVGSKNSLEEYQDFMKGCTNETHGAIFQDYNKPYMELLLAMEKKRMGSLTSRPSCTSGLSGKTLMSGLTLQSMPSNLADRLELKDRTEAVDAEVRLAKVRIRKKREKDEDITDGFRDAIEEHKEHMRRIQLFRKMFEREVVGKGRASGKVLGESVVKYYDDVIKSKTHACDLILLSNENLKRKGRVSLDALRCKNEYQHSQDVKTIDFEQMEILNLASERAVTGQDQMYKKTIKLLGECNFHFNKCHNKLEKEEIENKRITKEKQMRQSFLNKIDAEIEVAKVAYKTQKKEGEKDSRLLERFEGLDTTLYVRQVELQRNLENEVAALERKVQIEETNLKQLTKELGKKEKEWTRKQQTNVNRGNLKN